MRKICCCTLVLFLLPAAVAFATTFANRPLGEVIHEAPNIVRGQAGESHSDTLPNNSGRIFTYTRLVITDVLKGGLKKNDEVTLRQPGGQSKEGIEMAVSGTAHFVSGEDVVVLLGNKTAEDGAYDILNFTAGKYEVKPGPNGEPVLENGLGGAAVYDPNRDVGTLSYMSQIPLEVFRKIAKGEDVPEASHSQYKQSKTPAAHDDHAEHSAAPPIHNVPTEVPTAVPQPDADPQEKRNVWIPISFGIIAFIGSAVLWRLIQNDKKGS